jgi:hypothetical protein
MASRRSCCDVQKRGTMVMAIIREVLLIYRKHREKRFDGPVFVDELGSWVDDSMALVISVDAFGILWRRGREFPSAAPF